MYKEAHMCISPVITNCPELLPLHSSKVKVSKLDQAWSICVSKDNTSMSQPAVRKNCECMLHSYVVNLVKEIRNWSVNWLTGIYTMVCIVCFDALLINLFNHSVMMLTIFNG